MCHWQCSPVRTGPSKEQQREFGVGQPEQRGGFYYSIKRIKKELRGSLIYLLIILIFQNQII
jgi:hypothetical protein